MIVESDATKDQTYEIELQIESDDGDIDETVQFSVDENNTAEEIAKTIKNALDRNSKITSHFEISVNDEEVILTPDQGDDYEVEIKISEK